MSHSVILHQVSRSELKDLIGQAVADRCMKCCRESPPAKEFTVLTRKQTAQMLGVTLSTLHEWTKSGIIQGTRIGTRIRFRLADVETALKDIEHVKYSRNR